METCDGEEGTESSPIIRLGPFQKEKTGEVTEDVS